MTKSKSSEQSALVATPSGNTGEQNWLYAGIPVYLKLLVWYNYQMSENALSAENQQERLSKLSTDYVVALVDGEGYFSVSAIIDKSKNYTSRRIRLVFGVDLRKVDGEILFRLQKTLGCGNMSLKNEKRPNFSDCLRYQVRDYEDIKSIIIPYFQKYKLQMKTKRLAFEKFCDIARLFEEKVHLTDKGFLKVQNLARIMHKIESSETTRRSPFITKG